MRGTEDCSRETDCCASCSLERRRVHSVVLLVVDYRDIQNGARFSSEMSIDACTDTREFLYINFMRFGTTLIK